MVFTRRIGEVVKGADEIASGRRDTRLPVKSGDELGIMARAIAGLRAKIPHLEHFFYPFALNGPPGKGDSVLEGGDVSLAKIGILQHGGVINFSKENAQWIKITISLPFM